MGWLPLHIACSANAPIEVITALLGAYPNAVREKNIEDNLPLDIALKTNGPIEVLIKLLNF